MIKGKWVINPIMARYSTLHEERHLEFITYHCISYCYSLNSVTFGHTVLYYFKNGISCRSGFQTRQDAVEIWISILRLRSAQALSRHPELRRERRVSLVEAARVWWSLRGGFADAATHTGKSRTWIAALLKVVRDDEHWSPSSWATSKDP